MYTYQDWLEVAGKSEKERMLFIKEIIATHKASTEYQMARVAEEYFAGRNITIMNLQKMIYTATGEAVPDLVSANHKLASRFFYRFLIQQNQTLLGNGVKWKSGAGAKALGETFDDDLTDAGEDALIGGVSFGFFNFDHVDIFKITEFCPLKDEEDGAIKAGVRFWQLETDRPLRATMYEMDGYTSYIYREGQDGEIFEEKRPYIQITQTTPADGTEIVDGLNYETFPIVPFYANKQHQSELEPMRNKIDAYDLIASGYASDVDDCDTIYWTIKNAGGMDDQDLIEMLNKMRKLHAANFEGDAEPEAHTVDVPFEAREHQLDRLESQLYRDAMALDTEKIANGAVNIPQIKAAFEPLNEKLDLYEKQVRKFIKGLLAVAGVEDIPTFNRSLITNQSEEIDDLIKMAPYVTDDYITTRGMTLMGDKDLVEDIIKAKDNIDFNRFRAAAPAGQQDDKTQGEDQQGTEQQE